jgi:hypothetical protein
VFNELNDARVSSSDLDPMLLTVLMMHQTECAPLYQWLEGAQKSSHSCYHQSIRWTTRAMINTSGSHLPAVRTTGIADIFQLRAVHLSALFDFNSSVPTTRSGPALSLPLVATPMYLVLNLLQGGYFSQAAHLHWSLQCLPLSMFTLASGLERLRVDLNDHLLLLFHLRNSDLGKEGSEGLRLVDELSRDELANWRALCEAAAKIFDTL